MLWLLDRASDLVSPARCMASCSSHRNVGLCPLYLCGLLLHLLLLLLLHNHMSIVCALHCLMLLLRYLRRMLLGSRSIHARMHMLLGLVQLCRTCLLLLHGCCWRHVLLWHHVCRRGRTLCVVVVLPVPPVLCRIPLLIHSSCMAIS